MLIKQSEFSITLITIQVFFSLHISIFFILYDFISFSSIKRTQARSRFYFRLLNKLGNKLSYGILWLGDKSVENNAMQAEREIELWSFLGPFFMLATFVVMVINPSSSGFLFPASAIVGIILCWKWKLQGLYLTLGVLAIATGLSLWSDGGETIFWNILTSISLALTCTITALSYEEVGRILAAFQAKPPSLSVEHPASRFDSHLFEEQDRHILKLKTEIQELHASKSVLQSEHETASQKSHEELIELQQVIETLQLKHNSLTVQLSETEALQKESFQKLTERERIHETTIKTLEKEIAALRMAYKQKELHVNHQANAIADLHAQLNLDREQLEQSKKASEDFLAAAERKEQHLLEQIKLLELQLLDAKEQAPVQSDKIQPIEKNLSPEPKAPSKTKSKAKGKATKTNNWADTILSRWSEPQSRSQ